MKTPAPLAHFGRAVATQTTFAGGKGGATGKAVLVPPVANAPTIKELGISKREAACARKLAELPAGDRKRRRNRASSV